MWLTSIIVFLVGAVNHIPQMVALGVFIGVFLVLSDIPKVLQSQDERE